MPGPIAGHCQIQRYIRCQSPKSSRHGSLLISTQVPASYPFPPIFGLCRVWNKTTFWDRCLKGQKSPSVQTNHDDEDSRIQVCFLSQKLLGFLAGLRQIRCSYYYFTHLNGVLEFSEKHVPSIISSELSTPVSITTGLFREAWRWWQVTGKRTSQRQALQGLLLPRGPGKSWPIVPSIFPPEETEA